MERDDKGEAENLKNRKNEKQKNLPPPERKRGERLLGFGWIGFTSISSVRCAILLTVPR